MNNKHLQILLYFFIVLILQSCGGITTTYHINRLNYGLDNKNIVKLMGKPAEKKIINENEKIYVYYIHSSVFDLFLNPERFPYIGFYPLNRTGKEFWIVLNNDELESSGYKNDIKIFNNFNNNAS